MFFVMKDDRRDAPPVNVRIGGYKTLDKAQQRATKLQNGHILDDTRRIVGVVKNGELMAW